MQSRKEFGTEEQKDRREQRSNDSRAGQAGQGRAGQGRAGQGRARQSTAGQGRAIHLYKWSTCVYLIQGWLTVIDGLAVLRVQQEPTQHQGVVLCCHIPYGEEVPQALGHLLTVNCTVTHLVEGR